MIDYAEDMVPLHIVSTNRALQNEMEGIPSDLVPSTGRELGRQ